MERSQTPLLSSIIYRHNLLLTIALLISFIGLLTLISIQKGTENIYPEFVGKEIINLLISLAFYFLLLKLPASKFIQYKKLWITGVFFTLSLPYILPSQLVYKRWVVLGSLFIQVSEVVKIPLLLGLSYFLNHWKKLAFKESFLLFLFIFTAFTLVLFQPDLGSSLFFLFLFFSILIFKTSTNTVRFFFFVPLFAGLASFNAILFSIFIVTLILIMFISRINRFFALGMIILAMIIGLTTPFLWKKGLKPYQRERILVFLNPQSDPKGSGWQINQALIAIGSGKLIGKGYREGSQKGLAFLPEAHTDFIFASFAEEFGFLGSIMLLLLYTFLFMTIVSLLRHTPFESFFFGILLFFTLFYSLFININGELGLLPITGIPLPFMSYGGSALLTNFVLLSLFRNLQCSLLDERKRG